ncbi:hypothetical protein G6F50_015558 [Rhizopus delemar]|uniref:Uncharacterized protein n=1 Tax=Rhizopus delemar TaxID=936053 RepID=A0A9P6XY39_9FUNG|nr:hypothetical protein G6F50_015558 [Rhizopus delemar]
MWWLASDLTSPTTATLECAAQDHAQHGGGLEGLEQFNQLVQRQQQQPQADEHPAQVAGAAGRIAAEHPHARQDQDRGERGQVEGQQLDDQRGADVGPQHGGQGRHQADDPAGGKAGDHQAGGGAALQGGRDAQAGGEGAQADRRIRLRETARPA